MLALKTTPEFARLFLMNQPASRTHPTMTAKRTAVWRLGRIQLMLTFSLALAQLCSAYSVLTHEEVVDLLWKDDIQPLLVKRFPSATADDLRKAHAFAYGGSLVQDMGYYPFGSQNFSD